MPGIDVWYSRMVRRTDPANMCSENYKREMIDRWFEACERELVRRRAEAPREMPE